MRRPATIPHFVPACLSVLVIALGACLPRPATTEQEPRSAAIVEIVNRVEARPEAGAWDLAQTGQLLFSGHQVQTYELSNARLDLDDGSIVRLAPLTLFTLAEATDESGAVLARLRLAMGKVFVVLAEGAGGSVTVETPVGTASVRGSVMSAQFDPLTQSLVVACLIGHCALANDFGEFELGDGQESEVVGTGVPPSAPRPLSVPNLQDFGQLPEAVTALATLLPTIGPLPTRDPQATSVLPTAGPGDGVLQVTSLSPEQLLTTTPTPARPSPTSRVRDTATPAGTASGGTATGETAVHVILPPLGCEGADCDAYCGGPPPPPGYDPRTPGPPPGFGTPGAPPPDSPHREECVAFQTALIEQGVDVAAFKECVLAGGDFQTCADKNVKPAP